jgi:hypothetical protein
MSPSPAATTLGAGLTLAFAMDIARFRRCNPWSEN